MVKFRTLFYGGSNPTMKAKSGPQLLNIFYFVFRQAQQDIARYNSYYIQ